MGCCQSNTSVDKEQTRPLLNENSPQEYQSSNEWRDDTAVTRDTNQTTHPPSTQESPKWDAEAELRAIEDNLDASMVDISILDSHAFMSRNHSPSSRGRRRGEDNPDKDNRLNKIHTIKIPRTRLTGPPSVADTLSKPLPTRQSVEWGRSTTEALLGALRSDMEASLTPNRPLYQVLPFPPLLCPPISD